MTTQEQIAEINEQEKQANASFKKWINSSPVYYSVSNNGRGLLEQFVESLNREIADLKSEIVRLKDKHENQKETN